MYTKGCIERMAMQPKQGGVRVRESVWSLGTWDPTLLWYARAVTVMRSRSANDPRSWAFQAAVHEAPDGRVTNFLSQCQHGNWFFLPWHRAYLICFEEIVRAVIADLDGPADDWALPYWNYSDAAQPKARFLRPEFTAPALPGGSPNALSAAQRNPVGPDGDIGMIPEEASLTCLRRGNFSAPARSGRTSFGGGAAFGHKGRDPGELEGTPHGTVHTAVGGWMGRFNTAGLDPLFWLHHCNIDRLWEVWRAMPSRPDPTEPAWLSTQAFDFHDGTGAPVSLISGQLLDTRAAPGRYMYDDVSDPFGGAALADTRRVQSSGPVQLVGADDAGADLSNQPTHAVVALDARALADTGAALSGEAPRFYLNLENITGAEADENYLVYVTALEGGPDSAHFAGLLPTFGVPEASEGAALGDGGGIDRILDITELVERLRAAEGWREEALTVTFVPKRPGRGGAPLRVGRVSLYAG